MSKPTAIVYIDGLNLHRRILKGIDVEFQVDFLELCKRILPKYEVKRVRLFTSKPRTINSAKFFTQVRNLVEHGEQFSLHLGRMKSVVRIYPLHNSKATSVTANKYAKVKKIEEKGTDVALGSFMVLDAARSEADCYFLLSSDTDFEPVLRILVEELGVSVGVICPTEALPKLFRNLKLESVIHLKSSHISLVLKSRDLE